MLFDEVLVVLLGDLPIILVELNPMIFVRGELKCAQFGAAKVSQ